MLSSLPTLVSDWLTGLPLLLRVGVSTALTYFYLIGLVRLSGKRTVAQMNSFDWIFNVAMGSLTATSITKPDSAPECWAAMAAIVLLQWALTKATFHSDRISGLIKEEPQLLVSNGRFNRRTMRRARVNEDEVYGALRQAGVTDMSTVGALVFESDGKMSVLTSEQAMRIADIPGEPTKAA